MKKNTHLELIQKPTEFFFEMVREILNKRNLQAQPQTEIYLVNLLQQFMNTENLFLRDTEGHLKEEPLVFMLKEAWEESEPQAQRLLFRHVGDVSLYVAGYFQDSLERKKIGVGYYIDVGENAYQQVASLAQEPQRPLYEELSNKFARFVDVLAEIGDRTQLNSEKDLLRLYENWQRTQSDRAEKKLKEAGISVVSLAKKTKSQKH